MATVDDLPSGCLRLVEGGDAPRIKYTFTDGKATDKWWVPMGSLQAFLRVVGGDVSQGATTGPSGGLVRAVPLAFADDPVLLANEVDVEFQETWDQSSDYWGAAKVTVNYARFPFETQGNNAFTTVEIRGSGRQLGAPASVAVFTDGSTHPLQDPGLFVPGFTYDLTLNRLAGDIEPWVTLWLANQRRVNNATYRGVPEGQCLFVAPSARRTTTVGGVVTWEVTLTFEASQLPWNQQVKSDGTFDEITMGGVAPYPEVDFSQLFP